MSLPVIAPGARLASPWSAIFFDSDIRRAGDAGPPGGSYLLPVELALKPIPVARRAEIVDWAIALSLAAVAVGTTWFAAGERNRPIVTVIVLVAMFAFAWRRSHPLAVTAVFLSALGLLTLVDNTEQLYVFLASLVAIYTVGSRLERRLGLVILVLWLGLLLLQFALDPGRTATGDYLFVVVLFAGAWGLGAVLRERGLRTTLLEDHAARLDREQERRAREAVLEERARIARELHDVVAHSVSVMTVQAGVVKRRIGTERAEDAELLDDVERTGRQALAEMRRLLGLLRADDESPSLSPQPGLASLPALVERMRDTGLSVELRVDGDERHVHPGVDLAAYRIVQEALTNAHKHARGADVRVAVLYGNDHVRLEVEDDGHGTTESDGLGHGLVGMHERTALYGGTLETGPRTEGGYSVRATLPLEEPA